MRAPTPLQDETIANRTELTSNSEAHGLAISRATSISVPNGASKKGTKRAHEDQKVPMKTSSRKMEDADEKKEPDPSARRRPEALVGKPTASNLSDPTKATPAPRSADTTKSVATTQQVKDMNSVAPRKSAASTKPPPTAKSTDAGIKKAKPVLIKKFAKSVRVKVSKVKAKPGDWPVPLSAMASKLTPAQLAARNAGKRKPAEAKE
ncbi:hypothetical protein K458DRAFT_391976 [Lentithecium fluviatile CBS 122367]|uniref:Uncharacterized protein n=1 Tax=Lentithecium fluviatile CBS 122367 TaxID=1168545 RepID=A0A6G1ITH8_9PLEO|nr:hypothetical protein K458DRAFT_391976 [Lentithecium fluviatile CBS 122367]